MACVADQRFFAWNGAAGLGKNGKERYVVIKLRLFLQLLSCEDPEVTGMVLERMQKFIGTASLSLVALWVCPLLWLTARLLPLRMNGPTKQSSDRSW